MIKRTQELFEAIEAYLSNRMTDAESSDFEQRIDRDEELRNEVARHRLLHSEMRRKELLDFRQLVMKVGAEEVSEPDNRFDLKLLWRVAAMLVLVSGIALSYYFLSQPPLEEQLYSEYYVTYPVEGAWRGESPDERQKQVLADYVSGAYASAIPGLQALVTQFPQKEVYQLYLTSAYLNTDNPTAAIMQLSGISAQSKLIEEVDWYLSLSYLKMGKLEEAQVQLEKVVAFRGALADRAKELLQKIEEEQ